MRACSAGGRVARRPRQLADRKRVPAGGAPMRGRVVFAQLRDRQRRRLDGRHLDQRRARGLQPRHRDVPDDLAAAERRAHPQPARRAGPEHAHPMALRQQRDRLVETCARQMAQVAALGLDGARLALARQDVEARRLELAERRLRLAVFVVMAQAAQRLAAVDVLPDAPGAEGRRLAPAGGLGQPGERHERQLSDQAAGQARAVDADRQVARAAAGLRKHALDAVEVRHHRRLDLRRREVRVDREVDGAARRLAHLAGVGERGDGVLLTACGAEVFDLAGAVLVDAGDVEARARQLRRLARLQAFLGLHRGARVVAHDEAAALRRTGNWPTLRSADWSTGRSSPSAVSSRSAAGEPATQPVRTP